MNHEEYMTVGLYTTVHQTEMLAIEILVRRVFKKHSKGQLSHILSGSQTAIKILASYASCLENLKVLAKHKKVTLVWVLGHKGMPGNELTNKLVRKDSTTIFTGLETLAWR